MSHISHLWTKFPPPCLPSHSPLPPWSWIPLTCRSCVQQSEAMFPLVGLHFPRTSASWTSALSIHPHGINHRGSYAAPPRTSQAFNALNKPLIYSPAPWNKRVDDLSLVYCDHDTEFCSTDITDGWNNNKNLIHCENLDRTIYRIPMFTGSKFYHAGESLTSGFTWQVHQYVSFINCQLTFIKNKGSRKKVRH